LALFAPFDALFLLEVLDALPEVGAIVGAATIVGLGEPVSTPFPSLSLVGRAVSCFVGADEGAPVGCSGNIEIISFMSGNGKK